MSNGCRGELLTDGHDGMYLSGKDSDLVVIGIGKRLLGACQHPAELGFVLSQRIHCLEPAGTDDSNGVSESSNQAVPSNRLPTERDGEDT